MSQAAMFSDPSGASPIASDTEHCGQNEMRCADDFWRGLIPTVWANMYIDTNLLPGSSERSQRKQCGLSKSPLPPQADVRFILTSHSETRKYVERFLVECLTLVVPFV